MTYQGKNQYLSIPNLLSYLRIILIPFIISFFLNNEMTITLILALFSGFTDILDGYIARRFNMITQAGKVIDPVADKLTQFTLLALFSIKYPIIWYVFGMFMFKDALLLYLSVFFYRKYNIKPIGAKWFGKVNTALFYIFSFLLLLFPNTSADVVNIVAIFYIFYVGLTSDMYSYFYYKIYKKENV